MHFNFIIWDKVRNLSLSTPDMNRIIQNGDYVLIWQELMYSYDNRYFISGTVRSDGSSRLAEGE